MKAFLENPMWLLALTFMVYYAGQWLQKKYKSPVLSPILISMLVLIGYLLVFNISYEKYDKAGMFIAFWLKPSVVAFGRSALFATLEDKKTTRAFAYFAILQEVLSGFIIRFV
ncbi:hypothetical protein CCAN11_1490012 [Capnocytophaga canimorsus]|uniref:Uncharacterized protein n=1 Tax=Capnocytophaga canimorsus TaxID=28188 RepID=A0A0B7ICK1_9FLAO|nr:hypothetical protein CCAN11_1490012 [Capnocytophaga canimorsus]